MDSQDKQQPEVKNVTVSVDTVRLNSSQKPNDSAEGGEHTN